MLRKNHPLGEKKFLDPGQTFSPPQTKIHHRHKVDNATPANPLNLGPNGVPHTHHEVVKKSEIFAIFSHFLLETEN